MAAAQLIRGGGFTRSATGSSAWDEYVSHFIDRDGDHTLGSDCHPDERPLSHTGSTLLASWIASPFDTRFSEPDGGEES